MSVSGKMFVAGAILSPLVLTFGKLIVFLVGIVAIIWVAYTISAMNKDHNDNEV